MWTDNGLIKRCKLHDQDFYRNEELTTYVRHNRNLKGVDFNIKLFGNC